MPPLANKPPLSARGAAIWTAGEMRGVMGEGLRRRQRRSLPAWFGRWPALSGGGYRIRTLKAIRKMPKRQKGVSGLR